jgi:hypothetical protein
MSRLLLLGVFLGLFALCVLPLSSAPAPMPKVPKELLVARLVAARDTYETTKTRIRHGGGLPEELFGWSRRWLDAELALCKDKAARLAAMQDHVKRTREVERLAHAYAKAGQSKAADASASTYYRIEAEIMLLEAGGELPKQDKKVEEELKPLPKPKLRRKE